MAANRSRPCDEAPYSRGITCFKKISPLVMIHGALFCVEAAF